MPFIASFGSFLDETSSLADLILPDHSFLESWADAAPESGSLVAVASVAPPVMKPLYQTRAMPDVLLEVGRRLQKPLDLPWQTFDEMLKACHCAAGGDEGRRRGVVRDRRSKGGWWGDRPGKPGSDPSSDAGRRPLSAPLSYAEPTFDGDAKQFPFHFLPYASAAFLDGSLAHLPWLQEMPDPLTSAMWSSWVEINPTTASASASADGDIVEISVGARVASGRGGAVARASRPNVVAMPAGQGHRTFTRYATSRGENPIRILAPRDRAGNGCSGVGGDARADLARRRA